METDCKLCGGQHITGACTEAKSRRDMYLRNGDRRKAHATELQNGVAEIQEAKWGIALRQLMERTQDNPQLVTALNGFLDALMHQAAFGTSTDPLHKGRAKDLAEFFEEAAKALRWTVNGGNRPTDSKVDFSKWETE